MTTLILDFRNSNIPSHNNQPLEYCLLHGYMPGHFMTSMLCGDLFAAAYSGDSENFNAIGNIALWISHNAPSESYGNIENVRNWVKDTDGIRSAYKKQMEEKFFWKTMNDTKEPI
jgi:hypothetical protein